MSVGGAGGSEIEPLESLIQHEHELEMQRISSIDWTRLPALTFKDSKDKQVKNDVLATLK